MEDPLPPVIRCTTCQQIIAIDLLREGWADHDLNQKITRHRREEHPDD